MKKCSSSQAIKEMHIETTLRFHLMPVRIATIKNTNNKSNVGRVGEREEGTLRHGWWECKPYNRPIPLLGIHPKGCESAYNKGTCTPMFTAALFTIPKLWKQPRCPTTDEWINKVWYLCTMEFYSATKKNESLPFTGRWMEMENIILSEVSQTQTAKSHTFSLICGIQTSYKCSSIMKHWSHYGEVTYGKSRVKEGN
jgi:hypothetical protein